MRSLILLLLAFTTVVAAQPSRLDSVTERGVLVVATTGDYPPFSLLKPDGAYEGIDIDLARLAGEELGVEVRFVPTRWNRLTQGLENGDYDLVVGGVTRTLPRAQTGGFTHSYLEIGKSPLVRLEDAFRFRSLKAIDQPEVKVAVNPGGTNESFAREKLKKAQIVVFQSNLAIPEAIATGQVDVMFTDNIEARLIARKDPRLAAVRPDAPLSRETLGWIAPRHDQPFLNWLNLFFEQIEVDGRLEELKKKWF